MAAIGNRWAIVLAAGDGTRLRPLTTDPRGITTPKQYCGLHDGRTLVEEAVARARRVVAPERILAVVAARHRRWWRRTLASLPPANLIVQPRNRGTAAGVLLPLLEVAERDPEARVVVFPSDHYVERESILERALNGAIAETELAPRDIVLLGIAPDSAEPDYGWIVPRREPGRASDGVSCFVEKPDDARAGLLHGQGAVWNSFIFVARAAALLDLYSLRLPRLLASLRSAGAESLDEIYRRLDATDFSRDLLQGSECRLRVLPVRGSGWTDLGTPDRVAQCLRSLPTRSPRRERPTPPPGGRVVLSSALASWPA